MSYTYETRNNATILETYEWDNPWWEQAPDQTKKRVLYIGDSISCGVRGIATKLSNGEYLFDGFGTSKALDNPYFQESVSLFGKQQCYRNVVLFNNGLHGWHLDNDAYTMYYEKFVGFLENEYPAIPLALVLTTNLPKDVERNLIVEKRNEIANKIAERHNCHVIDLYAVSQKYTELHDNDGVHFNGKGYEKLAECILNEIKNITG